MLIPRLWRINSHKFCKFWYNNWFIFVQSINFINFFRVFALKSTVQRWITFCIIEIFDEEWKIVLKRRRHLHKSISFRNARGKNIACSMCLGFFQKLIRISSRKLSIVSRYDIQCIISLLRRIQKKKKKRMVDENLKSKIQTCEFNVASFKSAPISPKFKVSFAQRLLSTPRSNSREMVSFVKRGEGGRFAGKAEATVIFTAINRRKNCLLLQIHRGTKFLILRVYLQCENVAISLYVISIEYLASMTPFLFFLSRTWTKNKEKLG